MPAAMNQEVARMPATRSDFPVTGSANQEQVATARTQPPMKKPNLAKRVHQAARRERSS